MRTFYRWTEAAVYLKELIRRAAPLAGNGIVVENTPLGRRISCTAPGGGGGAAEYRGHFAVFDCSEDGTAMVLVVNGSEPDNAKAGYYTHGLSRIPVPASDFIFPDASGSVYVTITWNGSAYEFEYDCGSLPVSEDGSIVRELAYIAMKDGKITDIQQLQQGDLMTPGVL